MAANQGNQEHEAYLEIPVSDYIVIGETAYHKSFGAFMFISGLILGVVGLAIHLYTNWYGLIAGRIWAVSWQYWYISIPAITLTLYIVYRKFFKRRSKMNNQTSTKTTIQTSTQTPNSEQPQRG